MADTRNDPTARLAEFAATLSCDDLPADALIAAKALFLDALACALAGHQGEETGQMDAMISALASSDETSVIGGGRRSMAGATILNGYLITAVTMCDVHRGLLTHITPEVVPPALAIAERDHVSGRDLLAALAAGFEVTARVGLGLDYPVFRGKGWHGPGVIGPFGGAAAVGRLRGFDAETMARAYGLAGAQSAGTFAAWGTPTVKWHQCRAALSGLMAALLAEQDFVATREFLTAPDGGLYNTYAEGGRIDLAIGDLGERWELQQIALRLWPSATALQDVLTALFDLKRNNDVEFGDIERVRISVCETAHRMHGGFSTYGAKFEALLSAHYVAAVYLRDGMVTLDQFEPACYDAPELRAFAAANVEIVADASLKGGEAAAEIVTRGGDTLSGRCAFPLGAPENPLSAEQIRDKFRTYAAKLLTPERTEDIIAAVDGLEDLPDAAVLLDMLRPAP